jgi:hypothetical protein
MSKVGNIFKDLPKNYSGVNLRSFPLRFSIFPSTTSPAIVVLAISVFSLAHSPLAWGQSPSLIVDNFEGTLSWARNDKNKTGLSDIVKTSPGAVAGSTHSALMTFKSGQNSWASLSRNVDGAAWAKSGAGRLSFWLNGSGDTQGVALQLRGKVGQDDVVFSLPYPVRLTETKWRQVVVPFSEFKGPKGEALTPNLKNVYLLQFSQSGTWNSRFFGIDEIAVSPLPAPVVKPPSVPAAQPVATIAKGVSVSVDFKRPIGSIRAAANPAIVSSYSGSSNQPLERAAFRSYTFNTLRPKFARLDASAYVELVDSSKPSFNYTRLVSAARRIRAAKVEPLVYIANQSDWGLDAQGYAVMAAGAARALNAANGPKVRYFELAAWDKGLADSTALAFYNGAYSAIKAYSKNLVVGGYGAPSGNADALNVLLKNAKGLDFLSVSYFGATEGTPPDTAMMENARTITDLKTAAGLLDKSNFKKAALFVTAANFSSTRSPGDYVPSDIRQVQPISGAWWSQFLSSGSRLADQIFHSDAVNPEWGFLDASSRAYPAFYAAYQWNTYFPSGSTRVRADSANNAVSVAACNTATAHNLLLINTTGVEQNAQISIRGFPVLRTARIRFLGEADSKVLPTSPFQNVKLPAYGVAVMQFIEPPKPKS